jgi:hypothetical protein
MAFKEVELHLEEELGCRSSLKKESRYSRGYSPKVRKSDLLEGRLFLKILNRSPEGSQNGFF